MGEEKHDHRALLERVGTQMPAQETLERLSDFFRVFGDRTRLRILYGLFEAEMCVCAISELLDMSASAISHQLRVLRDYNLVRARREGKTMYYSLSDDHVRTVIGQGYEHILEKEEEQ